MLEDNEGRMSSSRIRSALSEGNLEVAKKLSIHSLGFLGNDGGNALNLCDQVFLVPSSNTARIQEAHITAGHALIKYVENKLLEEGFLNKL